MILVVIGILFLTFQFFIKKNKIETFDSEGECPTSEDCLECSGDSNNDNDDSRMTPYGYRKKKDIGKTDQGRCENNKKNVQQQKCTPTNNDVECSERDTKPKVNNNLCKLSDDTKDEPSGINENEFQPVDMDKYILKSKLKALDIPDKTEYLKDKLKSDIEAVQITTAPIEDEAEEEEEEESNEPVDTTTTQKIDDRSDKPEDKGSNNNNRGEETGTDRDQRVIEEPKTTMRPLDITPQPNSNIQQNNTDNNNIINNEQLNQITKELQEIKKAMFQHDKNTKSEGKDGIHVRKNNKDKDFNLLDNTHPFYNCYDKRKNPYTQFKRYSKEELSKGKKRPKFTDTPYKMFF